MKKIVLVFVTASLAIVLLLGLFQVVTGDSSPSLAKTCVGWNCQSIYSTADAPYAVEQTALAIKLPPLVQPLVGWNS